MNKEIVKTMNEELKVNSTLIQMLVDVHDKD